MTPETISKFFKSELGQQCNCLYSTSDDRVFIRPSEALSHSKGELDEGTKPLIDKNIYVWYEEFDGNNPIPTYRKDKYIYVCGPDDLKIIATYIIKTKNYDIHKVHELQNGDYVIEKHVGAGILSFFSLEKITKERFQELCSNWK